MDEEKKEKLKEFTALTDLENRVRALEYLQRHSETKILLKKYARETAKFCYENAELLGALGLFLLVNWFVWRKLGD